MKPRYSQTVEAFIIRHLPKKIDDNGAKRAVLVKKVSEHFKVLLKTASRWVTQATVF